MIFPLRKAAKTRERVYSRAGIDNNALLTLKKEISGVFRASFHSTAQMEIRNTKRSPEPTSAEVPDELIGYAMEIDGERLQNRAFGPKFHDKNRSKRKWKINLDRREQK